MVHLRYESHEIPNKIFIFFARRVESGIRKDQQCMARKKANSKATRNDVARPVRRSIEIDAKKDEFVGRFLMQNLNYYIIFFFLIQPRRDTLYK